MLILDFFYFFHSFKAKSWALFSLRDPCINFATEAKQIDKTNEVIAIQTLTFGLGIANNTNQTHSLATVCRMTRTIIFPPQFKTLQEWFNYAFSNSEIDGMHKMNALFASMRKIKFTQLNPISTLWLQPWNVSPFLNAKKSKTRIQSKEADRIKVRSIITIVKWYSHSQVWDYISNRNIYKVPPLQTQTQVTFEISLRAKSTSCALIACCLFFILQKNHRFIVAS